MNVRRQFLLSLLAASLFPHAGGAQGLPTDVRQAIGRFLDTTARKEISVGRISIDSVAVEGNTLQLFANMNCAYIPFREDNVAEIYQGVSALLPAEFAKYKLQIRTNKRSIEELVPQALRSKKDKKTKTFSPVASKPLEPAVDSTKAVVPFFQFSFCSLLLALLSRKAVFLLKDDPQYVPAILNCLQNIVEKNRIPAVSATGRLHFRLPDQDLFLPVDDILYIEAALAHKITIYTTHGIYQCSGSLQDSQDKLGSGFFLSHKSCLVNLSHIRSLQKDPLLIMLDNGDTCSCAQRRYSKLQKLMEKA